MAIVTLVSGGLDSTVMAVLTADSRIEQFPLFIDYGQIFYKRECQSCISSFRRFGLPAPKKLSLRGFGLALPSGLTSRKKDVVRDAFLPNRNLLFLVCGAAYAHFKGAGAVAIGLLSEETHVFPDQTRAFLESVEMTVTRSLGRRIRIVAPLMEFRKPDVLALAKARGVKQWYSCHSGRKRPCGRCISCREYETEGRGGTSGR
jgi:7-cyano-7-deazaguanine synthase